jgi:hypothetical protein
MNQAALNSASLRVQAEQIADSYVPAPTGRPSLLTQPDTLQLLLAAIADGASREDAAREAGIAPRTLFNWLKKAELGDDTAQAFMHALEKEEAKVKRRCTKNVLNAGDDPRFWAASMTYLERKDPEHWGRRNEDGSGPKVLVQIGVGAGDVQVQVAMIAGLPEAPLSDAKE